MRFDCSTILRAAHVGARTKIATNRAWRSYREALSASLKQEWAKAKRAESDRLFAIEEAAAEATHAAIPADVALRISDLCIIAGAQSFTAAGTETYRRILAEADDIERAARCTMIPALETHRHAH